MYSLQQSLSSVQLSDRDSGPSERQSGSRIDRPTDQRMGKPEFVEHVLVASVSEFIEGEIIEDLVKDLNNAAMALPGVLASNVGRCEPMLGDHTFMIHIRAVDTESCDAAYRAVEKIYGDHLTLHNINRAECLNDIIVVGFNPEVIGAHDAKWAATRVAIFKYKDNIPEEKKNDLIEVLNLLPALFPSVKQVSWGHNIEKERICRSHNGYADVDHELGVILGFSSSQDMYDLGADPKYWELLNYHGTSILEKYQVLTICQS